MNRKGFPHWRKQSHNSYKSIKSFRELRAKAKARETIKGAETLLKYISVYHVWNEHFHDI